MTRKKADGNQLARSSHSLTSRLLGSAVRATVAVPPPDEPWRDKKANGKNRVKKHK
jgi:hypothetical protein